MDELLAATEEQTPAPEIKKHTAGELDKLYQEADEADKELFAEMRSNILLVTGDHYNKNRSSFFKRLRDTRSISNEQKIRLTKNHIGKISASYVNHLVSTAPGVGFEPAQASELQDQKAAELNHAVWNSAKQKHDLDECVHAWAEDYVQVGEVAVKIFWDEELKDLVFEEIFGFNLLVDPKATLPKKAKWMSIRKMVECDKLGQMFPGEENKKFIQESSEQTYTIFDRGQGGYQKSKGQCLVREFYFRPCAQYPNGYFYYTVKGHILAEGELPAGKFPIVFKPFQRLQTRARGQSVIKTLRPYQVEINRSGSKIAEHQITLGDDKLLIQHGTKVSAGASLPGVRTVNYTGMAPTILQGRDGSQYLAYMQSQISEMYATANVEEKEADAPGQLDPYAMLFRSASQKKKFQTIIKRFESFLKDVCELYLDLARYHFPDEMVIQMVGKKESVNMAEFRSMDQLCYKIKITAQSEDLESKMGKQLILNHALQYVGQKLDKEDIGKLMKAMPYANFDESFNDLTLDYESATNVILALDRGERPPVSDYDEHLYMIKRLTARMRQSDFAQLDEQIQANYAERVATHEEIKAQQLKEIQAAKDGFIPTGGYLVACDFYVQTDPADPSKTKRVRLPSEALGWLIDRMETQGASLEQLESVNDANLVQMARMIGNQGGATGTAPSSQAQNQANAMAGGVPNGPASTRTANPNPGFRKPGFGAGIAAESAGAAARNPATAGAIR